MNDRSEPHRDSSELPLEVVQKGADAPPPARRPWWLRRLVLLPPIPALIVSGGVIGLYYQPPGLQRLFAAAGLTPGAGTDTPFALPPDMELPDDMAATMQASDVVGLARLLPRGDVSVVAPPFGAGDARIADILVGIGERVDRGQELAVLDNRSEMESAALSARSELAVAEANLSQTRASVRSSVEEARANLEQAEAAAEVAQKELDRVRSLSDRGVAAQAALDTAVAESRQADRAVDAARATLARYTAEDPEAQPDVIVATRNVEAARAALARAENDMGKARVLSPVAGTVLDVFVTPGERPGEDGIMEIGDIDQMMAEVEVFQSQVGQVEPGQPVEVVAEALGRTLHGEVVRVGLTVGRQHVTSDDTAANTDARVVDVLVRLNEDSSEVAARFTGLEVIARIDTRASS